MTVRIDVDAEINGIRLANQGSDPSAPDAGYQQLYAKNAGLYIEDASGTVNGLIFTEWADYAVVWEGSTTNPAIGNGTLVSRWRQVGDSTVQFRIYVLMGASTTYGEGTWTFSLPSSPSTDGPIGAGSAVALDNGTSWYGGAAIVGVGEVAEVAVVLNQALVGHANPFAWAATDLLMIDGFYEEAA